MPRDTIEFNFSTDSTQPPGVRIAHNLDRTLRPWAYIATPDVMPEPQPELTPEGNMILPNGIELVRNQGRRNFLCDECGGAIPHNNFMYRDGYSTFCEYCAVQLHTCAVCGTVEFHWNTVVTSDNTRICSSHLPSAEWDYCRYCSTAHHSSDLMYIDGIAVCRECFELDGGYCDRCGAEYAPHRRFAFRGGFYCRDCYNEQQVIRPFNYTPPLFFMMGDKRDGPYMGFELEVEVGEQFRDDVASSLIDYIKEIGLENRFYIKHDGSLQNGFELVSHPTVYRMWKTHRLSDILKWLSKNGCRSHDPGTCGLHVHLDRRFFDEDEIRRLKFFFSLCWREIAILSRREGQFNYCQPEGFTRYDVVHGKPQFDRYTAVNITSATVEIRVLRGTLNHRTFLASLQFCEAVAHYCKQNCFGDWEDFCYWVRKSSRNHLWSYLVGLDLVRE